MPIFDTHAHYDDDWFDADRNELIAALPSFGITKVLNAGTETSSSERSIQFAHTYPGFYAAVGWHPHEAKSWSDRSEAQIRSWAKDPRVVAIGEIGLDYHYDLDWKNLQQEVLEVQLCLAEELKLPVVIHDREAHGDIMDILRRYPNLRGEFHCFSGSWEMAKILLDRGWYLGFNGSVTMSHARRCLDVLKNMPLSHFLLETDCPYLAPIPRSGNKRNDSTRIPQISAFIADLLNLNPSDLEQIAYDNACRFFSIQD